MVMISEFGRFTPYLLSPDQLFKVVKTIFSRLTPETALIPLQNGCRMSFYDISKVRRLRQRDN
jgi:hypothetical protein